MGFVRPTCMTLFLLSLMFLLSPSSSMDLPVASGGYRTDAEVNFIFQTWMSKNGKTYNIDGEKEKRSKIFKDNIRYIDQHNAKNLSYKLGLTQFADLTVQEYQDLSGGFKPEPLRAHKNSSRHKPHHRDHVPVSMDWRKKGVVTEIKNQGWCNSCWAFSAVGAIEGLNKIVTGKLIPLSEQELDDCNKNNYGCYGDGRIEIAFQYLILNNGLESQVKYPYKAYQGYCFHKQDDDSKKMVTIDGYEFVQPNNETALKIAVARQPVSAAIDKKGEDFRLYKSGIYSAPCGTNLDHAVVIVGYGSENGQDYWIVKNSWGTDWGEAGFAKIARNIKYSEGACGIAIYALYPTKNSNSSINA